MLRGSIATKEWSCRVRESLGKAYNFEVVFHGLFVTRTRKKARGFVDKRPGKGGEGSNAKIALLGWQ